MPFGQGGWSAVELEISITPFKGHAIALNSVKLSGRSKRVLSI